MKFRVMMCAMAAGAALFAEDVTSDVYGVMSVVSSTNQSVVGVPWKNVGTGDVTLSNLVSTTTLQVGDKVYFYEGGTWYYYQLSASGWQSATTVSGSGASSLDAADVKTFAVGSGLLIERASYSNPIYLTGRYDAGASTAVGAGASVLISNPTTTTKYITTENAGDKVRVLKGDGGMDFYECKNDGWYGPGEPRTIGSGEDAFTVRTTEKKDSGVQIDVGKAALYINNGANPVTISWQ